MRHFMMDVWIWTEDKHSKPLKTIRFEQDHFPTEKECWHWFTKRRRCIYEEWYLCKIQ